MIFKRTSILIGMLSCFAIVTAQPVEGIIEGSGDPSTRIAVDTTELSQALIPDIVTPVVVATIDDTIDNGAQMIGDFDIDFLSPKKYEVGPIRVEGTKCQNIFSSHSFDCWITSWFDNHTSWRKTLESYHEPLE